MNEEALIDQIEQELFRGCAKLTKSERTRLYAKIIRYKYIVQEEALRVASEQTIEAPR